MLAVDHPSECRTVMTVFASGGAHADGGASQKSSAHGTNRMAGEHAYISALILFCHKLPPSYG